MAGNTETYRTFPQPMIATDELIDAWRSNFHNFNRDGKTPLVTELDIPTIGPKTVFMVLPKGQSELGNNYYVGSELNTIFFPNPETDSLVNLNCCNFFVLNDEQARILNNAILDYYFD